MAIIISERRHAPNTTRSRWSVPTMLDRIDADALATIAHHVPAKDRLCARLACRALRDAVPGPTACGPRTFVRSRALVAYAWAHVPQFARMEANELVELALTDGDGSIDALAELVEMSRGSMLVERGPQLCYIAAARGLDDALLWLHRPILGLVTSPVTSKGGLRSCATGNVERVVRRVHAED